MLLKSLYFNIVYLKKIQEIGMLDLFIDALIAYYVEIWDEKKISAWIQIKKMKNQSINEENLLWYGVLNT